MFRRPRFIPVRRTINPDLSQKLKHAQECLSAGEFAEAGELFEQLAHCAQASGIPRDAFLYLRASQCRLEAMQIDFGMLDIKQALTILKNRGKTLNLVKAGERVVFELNQRGLIKEAAEIKALISPTILECERLNAASPKDRHENRSASTLLPADCPSCGGTFHADEMDWSDTHSAQCPYCGKDLGS